MMVGSGVVNATVHQADLVVLAIGLNLGVTSHEGIDRAHSEAGYALPGKQARQSHIVNQSGATSGFEMCFAPIAFGAGDPNQNTSQIQHNEV